MNIVLDYSRFGALQAVAWGSPRITKATRFARYGYSRINRTRVLLHLTETVYVDWRKDSNAPSLSASWRCSAAGGTNRAQLTSDRSGFEMCPICDATERAEAAGAEDGGEFVYYAQRDDLIKIGRSQRVGLRMLTLGAELLAIEPGWAQTEIARHRQFGRWRTTGHDGTTEWFVPNIDLLSHIATLGGAA